MAGEMDPKTIVREEKLRRQEELRLRVQQLREQRNQRQLQRIQLLKTINTQRVMNQTLPVESFPEKKCEKRVNLSTTFSTSHTNKSFSKPKSESISLVNKRQSPKDIFIMRKLNNIKYSFIPPTNVPKINKPMIPEKKPIVNNRNHKTDVSKSISSKTTIQIDKNTNSIKKPIDPKLNDRKSMIPPNSHVTKFEASKFNNRKSLAPKSENASKSFNKPINNLISKKEPKNISLLPKKDMTTFSALAKLSNKVPIDKSITEIDLKPVKTKRWTMAAVERLSKPRVINKTVPIGNNLSTNVKTIKTNRQSVHPKIDNNTKDNNQPHVLRRSLSTVHFKRLGPDEARKCFKRTYSFGNLKRQEIEDELPADFPPEGYFLPIASERKKSVSFLTPLRKSSTPKTFLNTPKPGELRKRLNDWLQKRGKSLSTFHHLKCFGIESHTTLTVNNRIIEQEDDEDKENIEVIDDDDKENVEIPDDDSFTENITGTVKNMAANWRQTNLQSPEGSITVHPSPISNRRLEILTELTPKAGANSSIDPLLVEALFDLHQLILEDYSWLQCAEWLRLIIREGGEKVKDIAAYWECRAALEEKRGDFVRTVDCFNNALQRGSQPTNIEESLDNLLDKFMKLNLDPNSDNIVQPINQKLIDVKNVFKTSLIRFAIKREHNENCEKTKYIATPVRRSSRLSSVNGISHIVKPSPRINNIKNSKTDGTNGHANGHLNITTPSQSVSKSGGRKHLVQLCESLRNVENDVKQTLIFIPNKALNFNDCI